MDGPLYGAAHFYTLIIKAEVGWRGQVAIYTVWDRRSASWQLLEDSCYDPVQDGRAPRYFTLFFFWTMGGPHG